MSVTCKNNHPVSYINYYIGISILLWAWKHLTQILFNSPTNIQLKVISEQNIIIMLDV